MKIISHRGFWKTPNEKNTIEAFRRSFALGYGTETDVRDHNGRLVISHDMPGGEELLFDDFLALVKDPMLLLAINIKADGLAMLVHKSMQSAGHQNWFVFDMSVPDMLGQIRIGNPVYTRVSEYEKPVLLDQSSGIWLDAFIEDFWRLDELLVHKGRSACLVSPELHGRPHSEFWRDLKVKGLHRDSKIILCTDLPDEAAAYFNDE